eukprot:RCo046489
MEILNERLQRLEAGVFSVDAGPSSASQQPLAARVAAMQLRVQTLEFGTTNFGSLFTKLERIQNLLDSVSREMDEPASNGPVATPAKAKHLEDLAARADPKQLLNLARSLERVRDLQPYVQFEFLAEVPSLLARALQGHQRRAPRH